MDIDLLSKMVKELILDEDRVVLPGLGCFVAEIVPAYFSDKGFTINPPYRKLYFRSRPDEGEALVSFYAKSNNVEKEIAERIIKDFISELKTVLHVKKVVVLPGLGRLRATKENNIFFVADENLDIYPDGFGLEPISLKTHQETREEVAAAVAGLKTVLAEPAPEPVPAVEPEPAPAPAPAAELESAPAAELVPAPAPKPASEPEPEAEPVPDVKPEVVPEVEPEVKPEVVPEVVPEVEPEVKGFSWGRAILVVLIVLVGLIVTYMVVGRLCPEWIDQFLFSPEELEILNR